jgi:hypothetical protein
LATAAAAEVDSPLAFPSEQACKAAAVKAAVKLNETILRAALESCAPTTADMKIPKEIMRRY